MMDVRIVEREPRPRDIELGIECQRRARADCIGKNHGKRTHKDRGRGAEVDTRRGTGRGGQGARHREVGRREREGQSEGEREREERGAQSMRHGDMVKADKITDKMPLTKAAQSSRRQRKLSTATATPGKRAAPPDMECDTWRGDTIRKNEDEG